MSPKIGRNDPCPCGSGKKFKKCCYMKAEEPPEPVSDFPLVAKHNGRVVVALAGRIYPLQEGKTFHEFLFEHLQEQLGKAWWDEEVKKDPAERHVIVQWYFALFDWKKKNATEANKVARKFWGAKASGPVQTLFQLAFDVYILAHYGVLLKDVVERLRDRNGFQGARYEIAVAGVFARLNYKIEWVKDEKLKHCEFIAIHPGTGDKIAVEAKSRRRSGVLHEPQKYEGAVKMKGDIGNLLRDALTQKPDGHAFVIFVDLNLPATNSEFPDKPWFNDVREILGDIDRIVEEAGKPQKYNAIFVTNFASYYGDPDKVAPHGEHVSIVARNPESPLKDPKPILELVHKMRNYSGIPKGIL